MDLSELITELGIDKLDEAQKEKIMQQVLSGLQTRVGLRLAEVLTPEQMDHIEKVTQERGYEIATAEMERIYPQYHTIYQEEIDLMKDRLKALLPQQ